MREVTSGPGGSRTGQSRLQLVLHVFGTLIFFVIGLGLAAVPGHDERGPYALIFAPLLLGFGGVAAVALIAEARWRRGRAAASLGRTSDGQPATLVRRAPWSAWVTAWATTSFAVPLLVAGGLALAQEQWFWAAALLGLGVWLGRYAVPFAFRRPEPGGVTLSRDGITYAREEASWHVAWDDVAGVVPGAWTVVALHPGAQVHRQTSRLFGARKLGLVRPDVLVFDTRLLEASPEQLGALVSSCVRRPERQAELGTRASLEWHPPF